MAANRVVAMSLVVLASSAVVASAQETLHAVQYPATTPLYTVNQGTGALSVVGPTGLDNIGDMTSDNVSRLWGIQISTNTLVQFDPSSGAPVGSVGISGTRSPAGVPVPIVSLGYNRVTGVLYGTTAAGFGDVTDALYTIDPTSGAATLVGPLGFDNTFALAGDNFGNLYGISAVNNELLSINQLTGAATALFTLQSSSLFDMAFRPSDNFCFVANNSSGNLDGLNIGTGALTAIGPFDNPSPNVVGLAFVPAPGTIALAAFGGLLASRRRR